jgi:hypothetical protein
VELVWWYTTVIPGLRRLKQNGELEANLRYITRLSLKKKKKMKVWKKIANFEVTYLLNHIGFGL